VTAARVILVSDTHLSASAPRAQSNWDAVLSYVDATGPDLVIHLGDLTQDGARGPADLHYGRAQLDRLPVPWRAVPGNHDIGDNPWPGAPEGNLVDAARHQRWLDIVGPDHWAAAIEGWTLLAVNAQLVGSGLAAEGAQWSWLEEHAREHRGRPVALITHKPVTTTRAELAAAVPYRFWPQPAYRRLAGAVRRPAARAGAERARAPVPDADARQHRSLVGADSMGGSSRPRAAGVRRQAVRNRVAHADCRGAGQGGAHRARRD
jgi:predicted phosphodiesterase